PSSWSNLLNVDGSRFSFLSIPLDDVQRLSIRPFKWLRYVLYCICGARGNLYARLGDPPVEQRVGRSRYILLRAFG
ncbi:hypothetical protein EDB85DRAFT_1941824, partial [Lactarius pseudohatsudake]